MPKRRKDVQVVCAWIDRRIKTIGKPQVLQLVSSKTYFVIAWDRPRLPRLKAEKLKTPNNLMPIHAGTILNKRYVKVGKDSYLATFLSDPQKCKELGIYFRGTQALVPIYEVIDGLALAERRSDHILASYQAELESLRKIISQGRALQEDQNFRTAPSQDHLALRRSLAMAKARIEAVDIIVSDHLYRQISLRFAFERACTRLTEMAVILSRLGYHSRTRNIQIGAIQVPIRQILSELPFFSTKEIREALREPMETLRVIAERPDDERFVSYFVSEQLRQTARALFDVVLLLQQEADKVPDNEKLAVSKLLRNKRPTKPLRK